MIKDLLSKYVWIADTIYSANGITFEEINQKWSDCELSEGLELSKRTFHKWITAIEKLFGLIIECERKNRYRYVIQNKEDVERNSLAGWLFRTLSTSSKLQKYKSLESRVLLESIFTKDELLNSILDAMFRSKTLHITYKSFTNEQAYTFEAEPYCIKMFQQRWYLVAKSKAYDYPRVYAFDRIQNVDITPNSFLYPEDFSPEYFFAVSYGVIVDESMDAEIVDLKVHCSQATYLRSLPLHPSQYEKQQAGEYSIFSLLLAPTFDFEQKLLSMGEYVEVISPDWLRERMKMRINKMKNNY